MQLYSAGACDGRNMGDCGSSLATGHWCASKFAPYICYTPCTATDTTMFLAQIPEVDVLDHTVAAGA